MHIFIFTFFFIRIIFYTFLISFICINYSRNQEGLWRDFMAIGDWRPVEGHGTVDYPGSLTSPLFACDVLLVTKNFDHGRYW